MKNKCKSGFTLIEILVVVVIIGLLATVALPGYRKAVERSRVSDALTTMQAVAKSEHNWYLSKGRYTDDFNDLDINLIDKDGNNANDDSYETVNYTYTLQDQAIKAERNNGEYTLYKMYDDNDIYCLPLDHYICEQFDWSMTRKVCEEGVGGAWSNLKTNCYSTPQERCAANNEYGAAWKKNNNTYYCGYLNQTGVKAEEFQECRGGHNQCNASTFTGEGAKCNAQGNNTCGDSFFYEGSECVVSAGYGNSCLNNEFYSGSTCRANLNYGCTGSTIHSGAKCIGNGSASCENITLEADAECEGNSSYACSGEIYGKVIANAAMGHRITSNFYEGSSCIGNVGGGCEGTFHSGSTCVANNTNGCREGKFEAGSSCVGNANNSCSGDYYRRMYNFQGICEANAPGACTLNQYFSYSGSGCCKGQYCPEGAPKCYCPQNANGSYPTSC